METTQLFEVLERLSNLVRASERQAGSVYGLQPVHVHTLYFFSRSNKYSDTPAALTEYLGVTKGTASQTIKVLVSKEYLTSTPDRDDARKVHLKLTRKGKTLLPKLVPPPVLREIDQQNDDASQAVLTEVLRGIQRAHGSKTFGECQTCQHFKRNGLQNTHQCGLTLEPLYESEIQLICREHEPSS